MGIYRDDERGVVMCLQCLVAQTEASILLNYSNNEIDDPEAAGCKLLYTDENGADWTLKSLINRYSSYIKDVGYVLYTDVQTTEQINMAFNKAPIFGYLAVPVSCEETIKDCSLENKEDISAEGIGACIHTSHGNDIDKNINAAKATSLTYIRDELLKEAYKTTKSNDHDALVIGGALAFSGGFLAWKSCKSKKK